MPAGHQCDLNLNKFAINTAYLVGREGDRRESVWGERVEVAVISLLRF
jgi:hypothetical protein